MEKKYLLDEVSAAELRYRLQRCVPPDAMSGTDGYMVRSLYFDSLYDNDYRDKEDGIEKRKKIRLRIYSPDDMTAKLEIKEKIGQNQWKRSLTISREDAERLVRLDYAVLAGIDAPFAREAYSIMQTSAYVPKTIVQFKREAYTVRTNNIRITFDTNLRANESNFDLFSDELSFYPILIPTILEVKYNHFLLEYIKKLLASANQPEVSVSKYCMARRISFY